jgi:N-methylhydantoinase A
MRCEGQGYSVVVELPAGTAIGPAVRPELERRFSEAYERLYGHRPPAGVPLELVNLRARVEHPRPPSALRPTVSSAAKGPLVKGKRRAYFEAAGGFVETRVFDRYALVPGEWHAGPAVIEERETTTVLGPDTRFAADEEGHIIADFTNKGAS